MKRSTDLTESADTITARDIRAILFMVEDQGLTVKELRDILFRVEDQDKELPIDFALFAKLGVNTRQA